MTPAADIVRILIAHHSAGEYLRLLDGLGPKVRVTAVRDEEAPKHIADTDVLITIGRWLTAEHVAAAPELKWVQCLISGTDHLVKPLAGRDDVILTNARGIQGPQMAETAMMHLLNLSRGGRKLARQIAEHDGTRFTPVSLEGKTLVIVGVGVIAEHFARVVRPFGMEIVGVSSRSDRPAEFDRVAPYAELLNEAKTAQAVIAFAPLTKSTRGLFDARFFAAMNPKGWFINMGRGELVDEPALIAALKDGAIAGAALDVFSRFPLPADNPLWDLDNVLLSPFIGGQSDRYPLMAVQKIILPNLDAFLSGRPDAMCNRVKL